MILPLCSISLCVSTVMYVCISFRVPPWLGSGTYVHPLLFFNLGVLIFISDLYLTREPLQKGARSTKKGRCKNPGYGYPRAKNCQPNPFDYCQLSLVLMLVAAKRPNRSFPLQNILILRSLDALPLQGSCPSTLRWK